MRGGRDNGFTLLISNAGMASNCWCFSEIDLLMENNTPAYLLKNVVSVNVQDQAIMGLGLVGGIG